MAQIRILEILEAAGGGALKHVSQIAEHLDKDEFDLTVAISPARMRNPQREIQRLRAFGVRVEAIPMKRRPAPFADLRALRALARLIRRNRYDVVHAHSSKAGFLGRRAAREAGTSKVFYTPHAFAFPCGGASGWLYKRLERMGAGFGGVIVAVSEGEKELVVRNRIASADRVRVIRNAIEAPPEITAETRAEARAALGLPQHAPVAGTVGRLVRQKGCEYLVRAAKDVIQRHEDARFVLIGDGGLDARLRSLTKQLGIAENVVFAGHRADAAGLYAAMDLYVQPSLWEGLSYSVLEAMGRGLPVVATDISGNTDVVKDGATGLVVPPGDAQAIAEAVRLLLDDVERRRELGQAARELVLSRHSLADFIEAIADLYRGG